MIKADIINQVAEEAAITKVKAIEAVEAVFEAMKAAMQSCMQQRGYVWQRESSLGPLGQGACAEGDSPDGKGPRPPAPGRSTT